MKYMLICILEFNRIKYVKKKHIFAEPGDDVPFQPMRILKEPKLIKVQNNDQKIPLLREIQQE